MLILLLWTAIVSLHRWPEMLVPGPGAVLRSLLDNTVGTNPLTSLPLGVLASLRRMAVGYGMALAIGLALGLATARSSLLRDTLGMASAGLQSLPSVCWLPLALLWFGLNESAIIFVVVMGSAFCMATATEDGIRNVSPLYIKAGRTLGARGWALQLRVVLPAALPSIVTGMKLSWAFAWRSLMAGELLYSESGLGRVLTVGRELGDMAQVLATMGVILALGLAANQWCFAPVERALARRWGLTRA